MANSKDEFPALDASPVVLYGKVSAKQVQAYPILITADGALYTVDDHGMLIPKHDTQTIDESGSDCTITYLFTSATVAVKTITVSGTRTTISIVYS